MTMGEGNGDVSVTYELLLISCRMFFVAVTGFVRGCNPIPTSPTIGRHVVPPFLLVSLGFRRFVRHVGNGWRVVLGLGAISIHGAYTSRQRNINQKVEQDLRGKLGLPATGEIYYVQDRPLYQEYENLVLTTYDKWFGYHP